MKKIIIFGPTCSGKSALADKIAKVLNAVIINCDSMQLYSELPIITAQPDNLSSDHKLFAFLKGDENYSVANWRDDAEQLIKASEKQGRNIVIVGGTGLYLKSILTGFKDLPTNTLEQRNEIETLLNAKGVKFLYDKIIKRDPDYANIVKPNDIQRVRRIYGLMFMNNISYAKYKELPNITKFKSEEFLKIFISPDREILYHNINQRVDEMMNGGGRAEVESFLSKNYPATGNVFKAIGLSEVQDILNKKLLENEGYELMKKNTRNYAKRQITFFSNQIACDLMIKSSNEFDFKLLN